MDHIFVNCTFIQCLWDATSGYSNIFGKKLHLLREFESHSFYEDGKVLSQIESI